LTSWLLNFIIYFVVAVHLLTQQCVYGRWNREHVSIH